MTAHQFFHLAGELNQYEFQHLLDLDARHHVAMKLRYIQDVLGIDMMLAAAFSVRFSAAYGAVEKLQIAAGDDGRAA